MDNSHFEAITEKSREIYIHIPFCVQKCLYCDFLSFPMKETVYRDYVDQLCLEISHVQASGFDTSPGISSIFIGGGTPSLLDPAMIEQILTTVRHRFPVQKDAEISLECNPASTIAYKFPVWRSSGVNRLSIGLQSASNTELKALGRVHIFEDFLKCYQNARMHGFNNINIDLMNCIPGQTEQSWRETLRKVCMLKPEHLSIYNLIIEEGTPFFSRFQKGELQYPDETLCLALDSITADLTEKYGYQRYEVSNYAKPGFLCRHNYGYWSNAPYLGFGLGAASYDGAARWKNTPDFRTYMDLDMCSAEASDQLHTDWHPLSRNEQMEEFLFLGLRRTAGVSEIEFKYRFQTELSSVFAVPLKKYLSLGFLTKEGCRIRFTPEGMDLSSHILADFLLS